MPHNFGVSYVYKVSTGRSRTIRDWIRKYCGSQNRRREPSSAVSSLLRASPRQVTWLLLKQPEEARLYLEELCGRSPEIASCASLAREFCRILRQRDAAAWSQWRDAASWGPLSGFVKHLCRDDAAVVAALQHPWSNGPSKGTFTASSLSNDPCMAAPNSICSACAS